MSKKKQGPLCPKCNHGEMIFREIKDGSGKSHPVMQCPECQHYVEVLIDAKDDKFKVDLKGGDLICPICNNPILDSRVAVSMPGFRKGGDWLHIQCVFVENTPEKRAEFAASVIHHNWMLAMKMLIDRGEQKESDVPNLKPWYALDNKNKEDSMSFVGAIEEAFGNYFQGYRLAMQLNSKNKGADNKPAAV